jgi:hypothetical protein
MKIQLVKIAYARSGDKGDTANVGVIACKPEYYDILKKELTVKRIKAYFGPMVKGKVERFEMPNIGALNFLLHNALGGGGTLTLKHDAQGKTYSTSLLRMEIEVNEKLAKELN